MLTSARGTRHRAPLSLGEIQRGSPMEIDGVVLGSACSVNQSTDAVVPWSLSITNTSAGFAYPTNEAGFTLDVLPVDAPLSVEYEAGGSPSCSTGQDGETNAGWEARRPGCGENGPPRRLFHHPRLFFARGAERFANCGGSNGSLPDRRWQWQHQHESDVDFGREYGRYRARCGSSWCRLMPLNASQTTNCQISTPYCPGSAGSGNTGNSGDS